QNARLYGAVQKELAERSRAEETLRESEEKYRTILESIEDSYYEVDMAGNLTFFNDSLCKMLGYSPDELMGLNNREFMNDEIARSVYQIFSEVSRTGKPAQAVGWELVRKDKDRRFIEASVSLISDSTGEPIGFRGVARDITERKQIEQQLRQQERLAAVGQLAGGIAHDFNNLLTTIMLYAQMNLGKRDLPPNVTRSFETILDESRKAAELVQQILDFSRHAMLKVRPLDLESFTGEVIDILQRTIPESIHLILETGLGERAAPFTVEADPTRIQQVLMNLATNGRDAMPEGGELRFGLSRVKARPGEAPPVAEMAPGEWVCLAVSDTGAGMTEEVRSHLFEPFFTTKEPGKGTGLGLAQVYGIVRQHEGYIGVETELGKGTTFHIYLPASGAEEEIVEESISTPPRGQGETILLVEDNENLLEGGQIILESLGYRVLTGANGREALEVCQAVKGIDLVITDLVMPVMGGKKLMQELRKAIPDLKVLALTGYAMEKSRGKLKDAGFLDVVYKPFDVDVLAQIIRRALDE
ncbi:MAG: PAS domain S-box protein, partial [Anaerolineae bacterium]